jgi:phenylalanyl-tRNA synthetase alpha chain
MEEELIRIKNNAISMILDTEDPKELEEIKLQFLGRSGQLTLAMKQLPKIDPQKRKEVGILANEVKETIESAIIEKSQETKTEKIKSHVAKIDITNPGIRPPLGHLHLITQAISEISEIFSRIGFSRVRYPEVEWDWFSFGALNFPQGHPARDDWETFFVENDDHNKYGPMILTPHTSSGQIRELTQNKPPIKMLNIAKCYRRQSDASHTPMFHQFEGLAVNENLSIVNLKGVLDYFVKSYFGEKRTARIRPYHFEFTEPSFEVDVSCGVCLGKSRLPNGSACKLCKDGWLEMGGAGMVHPNVLKNCGINPDKFNGFAFGWGIERVLMMKEGIEIDDLRLLYSNKMEFLRQF